MPLFVACKIFLKSQLIALWEFPCTCFSLVAFKTLIIVHFRQFNYNGSRWGPLWGHLVWDSLCFLYLDIISFPRLGKFSATISSNMFSAPSSFPSGTPIMPMLVCLM